MDLMASWLMPIDSNNVKNRFVSHMHFELYLVSNTYVSCDYIWTHSLNLMTSVTYITYSTREHTKNHHIFARDFIINVVFIRITLFCFH